MKPHSAKVIFGLGLAGLLSGVLALLCAPLLGPTAPGPTFGLAIAVFLCLFARERSVVKALVLCVASSPHISELFSQPSTLTKQYRMLYRIPSTLPPTS
jgi:hypothetical protein